VAIKEFTGELDPVKPSRLVEFTGELDKPEEVKPAKPAGFSAKDTAIALGQGIVGAGKSLTDVFGAENVASKKLGEVSKTLSEQYTPERKAEMERRQALQETASKSGKLTEEISTFLGGVTEAPVQALAQGLGSIVPYVGTGIIGAIRGLGGATVTALNTVLGAAQGAGSVKGSLYDSVKQELEKSGMSSKEAAEKASKAQEYLGENFLDIAGGTALGGFGARYGVEPLLQKGAKEKLSSSLIPRVGKAALAEAPLEGAQGAQEQLAINRALQKQGFDVDTFQGVAGAAARDAAIGALTGSAVGAVSKPSPVAETPPPPVTEPGKETTTAPPPAPPVTPPTTDAATEALLASTIDPITGQFVQQFAAPSATETPVIAEADRQAAIKKVSELETDNARIQAKLDAGEYKAPQAKAAAQNKLAKQQALIDELKTQIGGQDVIQPIDAGTSGDGAGLPGGPTTTGTAAGATETGLGRAGVDGDQSFESAPQDGAGAQQPTLDINQLDEIELARLQELADAREAGYNIDAELINLGNQVQERLATTTEVIDEQALADQEARAAAAAEASRLAEEQRLAAEAQAKEAAAVEEDTSKVTPPVVTPPVVEEFTGDLDEEIAALNEEAAAELAGEATPPVVATPAVTPTKPPVVEEFTGELDEETPQGAIETKVKAFEDIRKLLAFPEKLGTLDKKAKTPGVQGEVIKEEKVAKPIKWRGKKGTKTENPSPYNFLNENGYYSDKSPEQIAEQSVAIAAKDKKATVKDAVEAGVESAAFDEAYDLYDSIAYDEKVLPEIKQVMAQRQAAKDAEIDALNEERKANREAKRAQMTRDGKSEKIIKEALSVIKNVRKVKYQETKPLEFMSEQEVLDLFKKNIGTKTEKQMAKEGGQARIDAAKNRNAFVDVLNPNDKIKFSMMAESILDMEIISAVQDNKVTTAGDRRTENYRKKQEKKVISEVEQQLKDAEITVEEREKKEEAKAARIAEKAEERKRDVETVKTKTEEAKSRYVSKIETAIDKGEVVNAKKEEVKGPKVEIVLTAIQSDERGQIGNMAKQLNKLLKDLGLESKAKITFGKVEGSNDGKFDPATGNITIKGEKGVYTGKRNLAETVVHEVMHYLTDHVVDNRKAYLASIKDPAKRKQVNDALNRLDNNYKLVKTKFGKKYNIGTMKEFIAEMYSNPTLQADVAMLPPTKEYQGNFFKTIVNNIATALGFTRSGQNEAVEFREIIEDIASILSLPATKGKEGFRGTEVSYSAAAAATPGDKTPKYLHVTDPDSTDPNENKDFNLPARPAPRLRMMVKELFTTVKPWRELVRLFQDRAYWGNVLQNQLNAAGLINFVNTAGEPSKGINNFMTQINLATSKGRNIYMEKVSGLYTDLNLAVNKFMDATNKTVDEALKTLQIYLQALHDSERRDVKYIFTVPLSTKDNIPQKGSKTGMISASLRRQQIVGDPEKGIKGLLDNPNITEAQSKALRAELDTYIFEKDAKGEFVLDANGYKKPNIKYVDPLGYSPTGNKDINVANPAFIPSGMEPIEVKTIVKKYESHPQKAEIDAVIEQLRALHKVTIELNKDAYYWAQPVSNRVAFYGFKNYVPLKANKNHKMLDEELALNFDGVGEDAKRGKQFQDVAQAFVGHIAPSNNPVLQSLSEAIIAANRAGNGTDLTLSIRNALEKSDLNPDGQGLIKGTVVQHIPFSERSKSVLDAIKRENTVFHYNKDGSIDVLEIREKKIRESIRRTYETANQLTQVLNTVTSTLGQLHTRYNFNFAPLNFVRDALTNAWAIGAGMGPKKSVEFITQIAGVVAKTGFTGKAFKVASLYESKDVKQIQELAKKDPDIKDMAELILEGGMVEYMEGLSIKSNLNKLRKEVGRSGIMTKLDQFNRVVDIWTNVFEIASRSAAYGVTKKSFHTKNIAKGMDDKPGPNGEPSPALKAAMVEAADFTKNLANFQKVGEYGRGMGAMFMFFRPSATGAVRAIEAVAPAFRDIEAAVAELPPAVRDNPKALAEFKKDYASKKKSAQQMMTALMAMGMFAYLMSYMMSEEDDMGRNKAATDDMGQWNRFWRIHIPGIDTPFQMPWGFGLGSFMAAGSQMMAAFMGKQSFGSALTNVGTQIALDSFVPIPVSRMSAVENPGMWFIDSITPSTLRPIVELVVNKNGLGQDIRNVASSRRMGDAFLGGDNIPESYKDMAEYFNVATGGFVDVSPNVMFFLFNSYMDGPAKLGDLIYNSMYLVTGEKEFKAKTDVPFIGSFIGAAPNVDGREWASTEKQILEMKRRLNAPNPDAVDKFLDRNPLAEIVTSLYDKNLAELNRLRKEGNEIRAAGYTPKERVQLLEMNKMEQNMVKANLVEMFKDYDIKP
jgi:hypothetical protein